MAFEKAFDPFRPGGQSVADGSIKVNGVPGSDPAYPEGFALYIKYTNPSTGETYRFDQFAKGNYGQHYDTKFFDPSKAP